MKKGHFLAKGVILFLLYILLIILIEKLYKAAKYSMKIPTERPDDYRFFIMHDRERYELIKPPMASKQLQDVFYPKQTVVFDVKTEEGLWRVDETKIVEGTPTGSKYVFPANDSNRKIGYKGTQVNKNESDMRLRE